MQVYNPATGQTADVPDKSYPSWALLGWLPAEARDLVDKNKNPTEMLEAAAAGEAIEVTAEDTGRRDHPSAKANKDK